MLKNVEPTLTYVPLGPGTWACCVCVSIKNVELTRGSVSPETNSVPVAFM